MIIQKLELGPFASNCYILGAESSKDGMIIDPGAMPDDILGQVGEAGLDIKIIVLTHGHIDHIGGLAKVKEATGADLAMHADDVPFLSSDHPMTRAFGTPDREIPLPDRLLVDGDSIDIGELHFRVLHTPGHSPGGICLLEDGFIFTGDTLFQFSIGRTDLPGGSYEQLVGKIHEKLLVLPDDTTVCPGHGSNTTIGAERHSNPFL